MLFLFTHEGVGGIYQDLTCFNNSPPNARQTHSSIKDVSQGIILEDNTTERRCGEAKYFRYSIEGISRGTRTIIDAIEKDFEKLKTFSKYEVCQDTVYAVMDKYYHRFDTKSWDKAKSVFKKMEDSGITVFLKEV